MTILLRWATLIGHELQQPCLERLHDPTEHRIVTSAPAVTDAPNTGNHLYRACPTLSR